MYKLTIEDVRELQLDVLQAVHDFCKDNDIVYSLGCGSMLGCARHKGYIPWDDDIDIYLLRKDYNKLIANFPRKYNNRYELKSLERDKQWNKAYAKASDSQTIFIEPGAENISIGVNIDIFPIDNVPENEAQWKSYNRRRMFFQHIYEMKVVRINRERSVWKNGILLLSKIVLLPFTARTIARFLDKYAQKFNESESALVFECAQGIHQKRPFPKSLFDNTVAMPFEDRVFMGFVDYDNYLSNGFGNWRQLPPLDKQITHHAYEAYLKD